MWKTRSFLCSGQQPSGPVSQSCLGIPFFIAVNMEAIARRGQCLPITTKHSISCLSYAQERPKSIVIYLGVLPHLVILRPVKTAYPIQLARDVAQCFIQALAEAGMKLPPNQLQDMTSSSEAVLQAVRAQSGLQPKHSKLPPLVPEFATIVAVEVSSNTPSSQPPHSQIPQHSRFFSSAPLVTAPVKGGGFECRPSENSANDRIVQKWGVYHTPEEFVRKAAQAGHPLSLETCLPEFSKHALQSHKNQSSIARIKKRTVFMREWVKRADSLRAQEHELKSRLDFHAKHILSNKKILLWKSLLEVYKYPDMGAVSELLEGTKLIGETDTTGLWPAKKFPQLSQRLNCMRSA